jgi:hypothetical protein
MAGFHKHESEDVMCESYRDQVRAAIAAIARDIATVQARVTTAANEYERAKAQGKLAELRADPLALRPQVLVAMAALERGVERMKELAAQIPANSDDGGLFDALAVAREAVESAERFIESTRDESDN